MTIDTKLYFKVMYVLMLVIGILYCCTIVGAIVGVPLIIGSNAMNKAQFCDIQSLKNQNSTLLIWGIVFGIFTSPIGIIAIVCAVIVYNTIEQGKEKSEVIIDLKAEEDSDSQKIKKSLSELESLKNEGVITEEEYQQKRKQILGL